MTKNTNQTMELHPLCTYFPRMSEAEFDSLKDNLLANGQTHPIYTLDGMILDGGNRYRALCELGIAPVLIEYTGSNPTQFILSSNLHRRHLTQGQSAAIVSASQSWVNAQATDNSQLRDTVQLNTATARAKQSGVGQRTQQLADKLVKEAPAELVKEVIDGKKSLNKAIKEITPPKPAPVVEREHEESREEPLSGAADDQQGAVTTFDVDNEAVLKVIESDDGAVPSIEELKKLTELNRLLNERIDELVDERDEAINAAKHWKEQFLRLEAELKELQNDGA
ncbi:MAG: hypothetical protein M0R47_00620 [Methylobacter sp.]|uniref:hypothetical protein n=1 Tax=Methylobacter sp. TaxID=2051955 RepID=UPI0025D86757|nr:hypothetical protein [Methylobacter sp.]MCK9619019.1 hypothetical protein [Methylobacter sp.]